MAPRGSFERGHIGSNSSAATIRPARAQNMVDATSKRSKPPSGSGERCVPDMVPYVCAQKKQSEKKRKRSETRLTRFMVLNARFSGWSAHI